MPLTVDNEYSTPLTVKFKADADPDTTARKMPTGKSLEEEMFITGKSASKIALFRAESALSGVSSEVHGAGWSLCS